MKIHNILAENFIGASNVDINVSANQVNLIAGPNGAGKSSLRDAVAMALTGGPIRVLLKKDYASLISDGASSAYAEVHAIFDGDEVAAHINLPSGKGLHSSDQAMPYALGVQRFSGLTPDARREFLFGLMQLNSDPETVRAELIKRGCDAEKSKSIAPMIRAGFEAAAKEAAAKARDGKAVWKSIAGGQVWGSKAAAGWQPPEISVSGSADEIEQKAAALGQSIELTAASIDAAMLKLGSVQQQKKERENMLLEIQELEARAGRLERVRSKLESDRDELANAESLVNRTASAVNPTPPGATACRCPSCNAELLFSKGALMERPELSGSEEAAVRLPEYQQALEMCRRALANSERDVQAASAAADRLREMNAKLAGLEAVPDPASLAARLDEMKVQRSKQAQEQRELHAAVKAINDLESVRSRAKETHADIVAWLAIADALAPDGIPGDMLQSALGPINQRLAESAEIAEWARLEITSDMEVRTGLDERPYALLSESEQWRADAMIAEAISHLSGLRLLMLDRFDVLDIPGRGDLIAWLDALAEAGQLDTALVFGTLKALPSGGLPDTVGAHWIENGTIGVKK